MTDDGFLVRAGALARKEIVPSAVDSVTPVRKRLLSEGVLAALVGRTLGQVCLRPVLLSLLEKLVTANTSQVRRERAAYASQIAFGGSS